MTKRENFLAIRELVIDHQELVDFIDHEVELLDRKSSSPRKPTKTQQENAKYREDILNTLREVEKAITMTELFEICEPIHNRPDVKPQRVTHILTKLINDGLVKKEIVKKVRYYSVV